MNHQRWNSRSGMLRAGLWAAGIIGLCCSCDSAVFLNNTASLGGDVPGGRGSLDVTFVNNTPYRAIFTFGTYDPQDEGSNPQYGQFAVDALQAETPFNRGLTGNTTTLRGIFTPLCGRVFALGTADMINRIKQDKLKPQNQAPTVEDAFRTGIYFSAVGISDPDANAKNSPPVAYADPAQVLQGADYFCDSLLIFTFELDPNDLDPSDGTHVLVKFQSIVPETP